MKTCVCVVGLGRIGLPIALVTAKKGHTVYGVDVDSRLVRSLKRGHTRFFEPGLKPLLDAYHSRFKPTTDLIEAVKQSSVILCCVGTRRFAKNRPNLRLLYRIFRDFARLDIRNRLIVLKTTVPIGTTRELAGVLERTTGLRADRDFFLAFSPERIVEGKALVELQKLPVIVGAIGSESLRRATAFYKSMGLDVRNVGKAEAAELIKLIDNTYRITRFAFSNDISLIAEKLGLNAFDIIDAANYRYPRNNIAYPSCGVSGYCLTKDPSYLEEAFRHIGPRRGFPSLWMTARKSYDDRTKGVVTTIAKFLKRLGMNPKGSRILVCGIAFKANVDDVRDSHGLYIAQEFAKKGMRVSIWDPCVTDATGFKVHRNATQAFRGKDAAVFTVAHKDFIDTREGIRRLTELMRTPLVYDGAGIFRGIDMSERKFHLIGTGLPEDYSEP